MEQERVRELLNKYFEGGTSEEEEALLKESLSDPALSYALRSEYGYLPEMASAIPEPSDSFDRRLEAVTRREIAISHRQRLARYARVAAAAAAIFAGAYLIFNYTDRRELNDTYKDPELAMAEVRNILLAVSEKMTTGTETLGSINSLNAAPAALSGFKLLNSVAGDNLSPLRHLDQLKSSDQNTEKK
jgi:hypothetical protein